MENEDNQEIFSPELLGPVFKNENISLHQVLRNNDTFRQFQYLATFIPDELIFLLEEKKKLLSNTFAAVLFLDISDLYFHFDKYYNAQNDGSCHLSKIFNMYTNAIIEIIIVNGGDVLKFSDYGILSIWKQNKKDLMQDIMKKIISCSFAIKEAIKNLEDKKIFDLLDFSEVFIKIAISAGNINFSEIGDDNGDDLHYVITGEAVMSVKKTINTCLANDLILDQSAWKYCSDSDYIYVIQDEIYVKIIKQHNRYDALQILSKELNYRQKCKKANADSSIYKNTETMKYSREMFRKSLPLKIVIDYKCCSSEHYCDFEHYKMSRRFILFTNKFELNARLKSFVSKSVLKQIENEKSLSYLTETRNITVAFIRIRLIKCTESELILLINECHAIISKACKNVGYIQEISLHDMHIVFRIDFGILTYLKHTNHCRFGILCARQLLYSLKTVTHVDEVSVGVSTGIACCMVIGHDARRHYTSIGPPIIRAENMMLISSNKVECDLNTLIYSGLKKSNFQWSGSISYRGFEKGISFTFIYEDTVQNSEMYDLNNTYPLLNGIEELEIFDDILNDIGLIIRSCTGILIEGKSRIGKSRILDAFDMFTRAKQITVVKLVLHPSYAEKSYSVIYKILEQILEMEDCKTIDEIEKNIIEKLCQIIQLDELCYLNRILRVRFKLSKQYVTESDWNRHCKTIKIVEKIMKNIGKLCILLDDVQYMDYMSWQFLTQVINNKNIVTAMTILESQTWHDLSRVEIDIFKDKRLLRHTLTGLDFESLSALTCQFLDVQGISIQLNDFLINEKKTHPGWIELFLIVLILCRGLNFIKLTPSEVDKDKFIFPQAILVTRIPSQLFPEEVSSPAPWYKRSSVSVCLTNDNFRIAQGLKNRDINALALEIYAKLSMYEQDIVKCAAILGKVFARSMLERIIPNHQSLKTATAVENLIRIRIFECAAQQRCRTKVNDLAVFSFEPRNTFSDMHHLIWCRCHLFDSRPVSSTEKDLSQYAHCRLMEFKVSSFRRAIYACISEYEKKKLHIELVAIYKNYARKCVACGGGSFLKIPGIDDSNAIILNLPTENLEDTNLLESDDKDSSPNVIVNNKDPNETSVVPTFDKTEKIRGSHDELSVKLEKKKGMPRLCRKFKVHPIAYNDVNWHLKNFNQIDFRNCRCFNIIEGIFPKLHNHIENIDDNEEIIDFMMEYAAALIEFGQPGYALKFLVKAEERNDYINTYNDWTNPVVYNKMIKKSVILSLRGNAYTFLGNYLQAKTNYMEALSLFKHNFSSTDMLMCYKTLYRKICQNIYWKFSYNANIKNKRAIIARQNIASCLRLVSLILMITNEVKASRLASLQSIIFGFSTYDTNSFYDQSQLYLAIVKVYGQVGDLSILNHVEKYILFAINHKHIWNNSEDIVMLAHVYYSIFKVSLLRGYLERAAQFGQKALQLAKSFRIIRLELEILPLLIQTQQLRDISFQDVDKSALTWYYALCMDLLLDAGIFIESYETCASYANRILDKNSDVCTLRDSKCLRHLTVELCLWQLRKSAVLSTNFINNLDYSTMDFEADDFSQIITLCKILECNLLLFTRCLNLKKSDQMELILSDISDLMKILDNVLNISDCIKPRYYLLKAYFNFLHSRTFISILYLRKARKYAIKKKNVMVLAWIRQNKNVWKAVTYNSMARYWEEHIDYQNTIVWQDVDMFNLKGWSNLLYALPVPYF